MSVRIALCRALGLSTPPRFGSLACYLFALLLLSSREGFRSGTSLARAKADEASLNLERAAKVRPTGQVLDERGRLVVAELRLDGALVG